MMPVIAQGHVVDVTVCPLSLWDADTVSQVLRQVSHVPVRADVADDTVHLYPARPLTTSEEVTALRAFLAVTDARVAFHRDVIWTGVR